MIKLTILPRILLCLLPVVYSLFTIQLVQANEATQQDIVLVLDNSGSMQGNDPEFLTKQVVSRFIENTADNVSVSIIVFDQSVQLAESFVSSTEENKAQLIKSLELIDYKGKYTDSPAAIERAIYELKNNSRQGSQKYIIFLTDGIVDTGDKRQDQEKSKWLRQELAADASENNIKIFAVALTEAADFQLIQSLAQRTGADYFRALEASDLETAFNKIHDLIRLDWIAADQSGVTEEEEQDNENISTVETIDESDTTVAPPPVVVTTPEQPQVPSSEENTPLSEEDAPVTTFDPEQLVVRDPVNVYGKEPSTKGLSSTLIIAFLALIAGICYLLFVYHRFNRKGDEFYIPKAFLMDVHNHTNEKSYELGQIPTMIGRVVKNNESDLNYIAIQQTTIGRRHALIEYRDFSFWVTDQGSTNGTYVNDRLIEEATRLKDSDRIRFHKFEFVFEVPDLKEDGMTEVSATLLKQAVADKVKDLPEPQFDISMSDEMDLDLSAEADPNDEPQPVTSSEDVTILPEDTESTDSTTDENLIQAEKPKD